MNNLKKVLQKLFDNKLKVTPTAFFVADFNYSSCESDNFMFTLLC